MLPGNHRASDALATRRDIQCEREREDRTLGQTRRDEANLCLPRRSLGEGGTSDISLLAQRYARPDRPERSAFGTSGFPLALRSQIAILDTIYQLR